MADPEPTTQKTCTACGITKELADFSTQRLGKYGRRSTCRQCHNANGRLWKATNKARRAAVNKLWKERNPEKVRSSRIRLDARARLSGKLKARWRLSREKHRERVRRNKREWAQRNPVAYKAMRQREYAKNRSKYIERALINLQRNRERYRVYAKASAHRRRELGFNPWRADIAAIMEQTLESYRVGDQYWDCYDAKLIDTPTIDHIVPIEQGGVTEPENLCVTSRSNNASKGTKSLLLWLVTRAAECSPPKTTFTGSHSLDRKRGS